ncbi:MAG: tyrosine--tRNA ligase [Euryarchaeota archaeon]|nr:tyrosine--tRNA ligase [Euryarchaeota archaeon]
MADGFERVARNAEEIVTREELRELCGRTTKRAYIGIEPSGQAHLGWKIVAEKVRDLSAAGFDMTVLLADWHAHINDKFGGDLDRIRTAAEYIKDALEALGVPRESVRYVHASEYIGDPGYWERIIRISKATSLSRIKRAMDIMGRKEDELELDSSRLIYPMMQVADIFHLDVDLAYGGLDQRKAHMLARDVGEKYGWKKVTALHTPLLPSLTGADRMDPLDAKMSKSRPDSAVFVTDSEEDIRRKIKGAFCPARQVEGNPVLDLCRLVLFPYSGPLKVSRPAKYGGDLVVGSYPELAGMHASEKLHPADLKSAVAGALMEMLAPARRFFEGHPDNFEAVRKFTATR